MQVQNDQSSSEHMSERLLDKAESTFWLLDRVSSMNFAVIAEGEGDLNLDAVRKALDSVQKNHPLANVQVELGNEFELRFRTKAGNRIPLKIFEFENEVWKKILADEMILPFSEGESPLIRAALFESKSGQWVFSLIFHHSIADGRSGSLFLSEVLKRIESNLNNNNILNYHKIPKSVLSLLQINEENPETENKTGVSEEITVRIASLPMFSKKNQEANPVLTDFQLSGLELKNLLSLCKKRGATLHGVIGASQLIALYSLFDTTEPILLNLSNPADLKPNLSEEIANDTLGLYITLLTLGIVIRQDSDPWTIAKEISTGLKTLIRNGKNDISFYELIPSANQILSKANGIKILSNLLQRFPQASVLSNVGILPDLPKFEKFTVSNLSFTVHPSLSQSVFVSASTYQGKLTILLNHDSNRWDSEKFGIFKERFEEILRREANQS